MDKITISNLQGESGLVNVVRYFKNNGQEYLIYSLNEVDEAGYTRLYVAKVNGVNGNYNAETLNDNEWNEVKNLVKVIVKANKEGMPVPVQDMNPSKINNLILKDKKVFKLNAPLVNDLSANQPNFAEEGTEETGVQKEITPTQPTFDMPSAPAFETPAQPAFDMPSAPTFETPVQPTFDMPSAPTFETPVQPTFDFSNTGNNAFDLNNNVQSTSTTDDYKIKYEEMLTKNNELQTEINNLKSEILQYKNIVDNIKNMIEK